MNAFEDLVHLGAYYLEGAWRHISPRRAETPLPAAASGSDPAIPSGSEPPPKEMIGHLVWPTPDRALAYVTQCGGGEGCRDWRAHHKALENAAERALANCGFVEFLRRTS